MPKMKRTRKEGKALAGAKQVSAVKISKETVRYVAHLARIELNAKEVGQLSAELQKIIAFINKLKKIEVKDVAPTSHILPIKDVVREDNPDNSLPLNQALGNAPRKEGSFFAVPKVIE